VRREQAAADGGHVDEADRLLRRAPVGSGDAGDRHRHVAAGAGQRALGHGAGGGLAYRAVLGQDRLGNPQQFHLRLIGVDDVASLDDARRARDLGEAAGDQAAGA
jgi:hypothetical protein